MKKFISYLSLLLALIMVLITVVGCATSTTAPAKTGTTAGQKTDSKATNAPTVATGGTLTLTWGVVPNPATYTGNPWSGTWPSWFWDLGVDGLFRLVRSTDKVYNMLAEDVTHQGNRTIVKMRHDAKWSDGEPITAKDIWGYYRVHRDTVTRYVTAINQIDDYTIEFVFAEPAPFDQFRIWLIAPSQQASLPYHIYKEFIDKADALWKECPKNIDPTKISPYGLNDTDKTWSAKWQKNWDAFVKFVPKDKKMISAGPYVQDKFNEAQMILKKNPNYWNASKIKFDTIINKATTPEQGVAMLKSAQTDSYPGSLPIDVATAVLASNKDIVFYPMVDPACHGFYFNQQSKNAPMSDIKFRKAINYLIDKKPAREVGNYYGQEFNFSTTGEPPGFVNEFVTKSVVDKMARYTTDPSKAEALLTEAGYKKVSGKWLNKDNKPIKIILGVNGAWQPAAVVGNVNAIVAEQLKAFGFESEVRVTDGAVYWDRVKAGAFDMTFDWIDVSWSFLYPYFALKDYFDGTVTADQMKFPLNKDTGKPTISGIKDFDGNDVDPVALVNQIPQMTTDAARQKAIDQLVWIANEYCFGINLYQNTTGVWENRKDVKNLPYADQIDANKQFMKVPTSLKEAGPVAELNWGFGGYVKLFTLEPAK